MFYYFQKYHRLRIFKKSWGIQHLPVAIMLTFVYKDKNSFPDEKRELSWEPKVKLNEGLNMLMILRR